MVLKTTAYEACPSFALMLFRDIHFEVYTGPYVATKIPTELGYIYVDESSLIT